MKDIPKSSLKQNVTRDPSPGPSSGNEESEIKLHISQLELGKNSSPRLATDLLPHLILVNDDIMEQFPKEDMRILLLSILNAKVKEVRKIPLYYQKLLVNRVIKLHRTTKSVSFVVDNISKLNSK